MVAELLVLSQAGEVDAPPERVDLEDAARRAEARWDGAAGGRVRSTGEPADGFCPPADLDRAIDALVENAIRYGNGEVEVRSRTGAVDVLDRGPGLSEEDLAAAFERFHRGAAGRAGPNRTGLGLPIARELARRWGGEVTLANRDGGGGRATLTVPPFPEA
jgi:two-component system, OmpR family, sensor kinase